MAESGRSLVSCVMREADFGGLFPSGRRICGIDEAGRGPLAGPVAAAAVILPDDFDISLLGDSKALSRARREKAYGVIASGALAWAVGWATHEEIGELNILWATMRAMRRAYDALDLCPGTVFVDGNRVPELGREAVAVISGDALIPAIMAASIMAKVARDAVMDRLDEISPGYGFSSHRGYPTKAHRDAIGRLGPSLWQRPGFRT